MKVKKKKESKTTAIIKSLFADLLFPRRCVMCDEITDDRSRGVCRSCAKKIVYISPPYCPKCGRSLGDTEEEFCADCLKKKHRYIQGTALYEYGDVADSLYRFKYRSRSEYALFFGKELAEKKGAWLRAVNPDALVPVPIHGSRKRKRGYNQAQLIADELARYIKIPVENQLVVRTRKTMPQRKLSDRQRQNNLKKSFKILQNDVKLNTIVIVDDIYTTGSTIDAIAQVLTEAGVKKIYYMALAIGRGC